MEGRRGGARLRIAKKKKSIAKKNGVEADSNVRKEGKKGMEAEK